MTKLSTPQTFDHSRIAATDAYEQLQPFIEYTTQLLSNLINLANNGISIGDNFDADFITAVTQPNISTTVLTTRIPVAVLVGRQDPITTPITYFVWQPTADGKGITIRCDQKVTLTLICLHP